MKQCEHLFDLDNEECASQNVSDFSQDNDETSLELIPLKRLKNGRSSKKIWLVKDDFQFLEQEPLRFDEYQYQYEAEVEKSKKRAIFEYFRLDISSNKNGGFCWAKSSRNRSGILYDSAIDVTVHSFDNPDDHI